MEHKSVSQVVDGWMDGRGLRMHWIGQIHFDEFSLRRELTKRDCLSTRMSGSGNVLLQLRGELLPSLDYAFRSIIHPRGAIL